MRCCAIYVSIAIAGVPRNAPVPGSTSSNWCKKAWRSRGINRGAGKSELLLTNPHQKKQIDRGIQHSVTANFLKICFCDIVAEGDGLTETSAAGTGTDQEDATYGQGGAVGSAVGKNPVSFIIPCHRVIGSDGTMTGFGGGIPTKKALLRLELEHSQFQ